jgi:hypothetical protein
MPGQPPFLPTKLKDKGLRGRQICKKNPGPAYIYHIFFSKNN